MPVPVYAAESLAWWPSHDQVYLPGFWQAVFRIQATHQRLSDVLFKQKCSGVKCPIGCTRMWIHLDGPRHIEANLLHC